MTQTPLHVIGNLVDDPDLRFTPSGAAVANFRVASTPRAFDRATGEWKDGETMFLSCSVWRAQAEHVAESLRKGMRVVVIGKLKVRSYTNTAGEKRTVFEVDVDEVGPSLRYATAAVTREQRTHATGGDAGWGGRGEPGRGGRDTGPAHGGDDPWQTRPAPRRDPDDPWATRPRGTADWVDPDQDNEPPF